MHSWTRPAAVATATALLLAVAGCTDAPPPASAAAEAVASALTAGDLSTVPVLDATADAATGELGEVLAGMDGPRPQVTVADTQVSEDDQAATATFVDRDLPVAGAEPAQRSCPTTADLVRQDDADQSWALAWAPSVLGSSRTSGEQLVLSRDAAARGDVLGAGGRLVVTGRPVLRVGVDKTRVAPETALLRSGVTPEDALDCSAATTVEGRTFTSCSDCPARALGGSPLRSVIASSCSTALISARDRLPQPDLVAAAAALGIGADCDVGVPAFTGSVPDDVGATEHAASMIGQGRVEASPLSMATAAATIARGALVTPRLLGPDLCPHEPAPSPAPVPTEPPTDEEAAQLQAMMRAVVTDGSATFLADIPGVPVGAKTGTAEYGTEQPLRARAWMISTQADLAVAVLVEDGASGSRTAGPLLEQLLADLPTDQPEED